MKTTDVYIVLDQSGSMDGAKTQTARKMVYEMADLLAREEARYAGGDPQHFRITVIPFGSQVGRLPAKRPLEIVTNWPMSIPLVGNLGQMTALRDAIGEALELAERSTAEAQLVNVFTDGGENHSYKYSVSRLTQKLAQGEKGGKLTVTLAGPAIARDHLVDIGIPVANFRAWDGTETELRSTASVTVKALGEYVNQRSRGITSSKGFYADPSTLTVGGIRAHTRQVTPAEIRQVTRHMAGRAIADFFGSKFEQGTHYYQLIKPEYLQDDKDLVIYIKDKGEYRQGSRAVRSLLGLPETGKIRIKPAEHASQYDVFVQSASNNRKVVEGQVLLTIPA